MHWQYYIQKMMFSQEMRMKMFQLTFIELPSLWMKKIPMMDIFSPFLLKLECVRHIRASILVKYFVKSKYIFIANWLRSIERWNQLFQKIRNQKFQPIVSQTLDY